MQNFSTSKNIMILQYDFFLINLNKKETMKKSFALLFLGILSMLSSCDIEKRKYFSGFYVNHSGKSKINSDKKDLTNNASTTKHMVDFFSTNTLKQDVETQQKNLVTSEEHTVYASLSDQKTESKKLEKSEIKTHHFKNISHSNTSMGAFTSKPATNHKQIKANQKRGGKELSSIVYILLAIFIPFVSVGLLTDWGSETWLNLLLCLLCGLPGIIHAFIILKKKGII